MKKIFLLLLLATAPVFAQNTTFSPLGKWQGTDKGESIFVTFDKEGYVTLQKGHEIIGGKSFEMEGVTASMTYKFNPEGVANHLDMVIKILEPEQSHTLFCLYKVLNNDEVVIAMGGMERPTDFEGAGTVTFKRVK